MPRRFQFRLRRKTASLVLTGCGVACLFSALETAVMWALRVPNYTFSLFAFFAMGGAAMLATGHWLRRGRIQFRLRTLMIGVTLFALIPCGYIGWQAKIMRGRTAMLDLNMPIDSFEEKRSDESIPPIRRWFGDKAYEFIVLGEGATDSLVERYRNSFPEALVYRVSQRDQMLSQPIRWP